MELQWSDPNRRREFREGMRAMAPAQAGIVAWGLVTGVAMVKAGLSVPIAVLMSLLVYAGSAQLASLPLIAAAAPIWVISVTALITNLRFVIYGAAMRSWLVEYDWKHRAAIGYITGDFSFVLFMTRVAREGAFPNRDAWLLGMALANWIGWQASSIAGIVAASFIPTSWGLQFAGVLALIALVVPLCKQRPQALGALAAGAVALIGHAWPYKAGLLAGVLAGILVATLADEMATTATVESEA